MGLAQVSNLSEDISRGLLPNSLYTDRKPVDLSVLDLFFRRKWERDIFDNATATVVESDKVEQQIIAKGLNMLKENIGKELFDQLSYSDRMLMIKTAGVIDFGRSIDLNNVEKEIEEDEYSS